MGIRGWWTRLTHALQRERGPTADQPPPARTRTEQDADREERRQGGMSAEDRDWEQASQQRDRDRQAGARKPHDAADA